MLSTKGITLNTPGPLSPTYFPMRSTTARSHWRAILGDMAATSPTMAPPTMANGVCSAAVAAAPSAVGTSSASVARKLAPPPEARRVGRLPGTTGPTRSVLGGIGVWSPAAVQVDDHVVQREPQVVRLAEEGILERRELVEQILLADVG